ncbi:MAG: FG-GAP-like repeat-containing protein [candidate division WOR-3 bacterium]
MDTSSFDEGAVEFITNSSKLPKKILRYFGNLPYPFLGLKIVGYWQEYDTIQCIIKGYVKGKNGLTLDGNGNGIPEGSPIDDYIFKFYTSNYGFTPSLKDSFPFFYSEPGSAYGRLHLPNLWDINNDGYKEIVFGWRGPYQIGAVDYKGKLLPNFPINVGKNNTVPPALADLDGDKYFEIIPPAVIYDTSRHKVYFKVFKSDGSYYPNWPRIYEDDSVYFDWILYTPTVIYDLDQDNNFEIIFPVRPNYLFIFKKNGELISTPPFRVEGMIEGLSIGDLNADGTPEIVATSFILRMQGNDTLWVTIFEPDGSYYIPPCIFPGIIGCQPLLGDINGDNFLEIIFHGLGSGGEKIYAMDHNGNILPGFPFLLPNEWIWNGFALGDINNDGLPEIIAVEAGNDWNSLLYVIDGNGNVLPGFPVQVPQFDYGGVQSPPTCVDINEDGYSEIFVLNPTWKIDTASNGDTVYLHFDLITGLTHTGEILPGFPIVVPHYSIFSSPVLADIDKDGFIDISFPSLENKGIISYSFTTQYTSYSPSWPLPYHDIHNTSNYHYTPPEIEISELKKYKHILKFSTSEIVRNEFKFKLSLPSGLENKKLKILFYSVNGIKLKEIDLWKFYKTHTYSIDIKNLKKGVYFYQLKIEKNEILKGKFIKL